MVSGSRSGMDDGHAQAALACLSMLRGASVIMSAHKSHVSGLLSTLKPVEREALERLVADLAEVLGADKQQGQQEKYGGAADTGSEEAGTRPQASGVSVGGPQPQPMQAGRVPQQQQEQQQQPMGPVVYCSSLCNDPLGVAEVLEQVMSFSEGCELLRSLNRVCRLWRRVSEEERLCLPVVERYMPSALLGGEGSLHARLGGNARRCLLMLNAWSSPARVGRRWPRLEDLRCLVDIVHEDKPLFAALGPWNWVQEEDSFFKIEADSTVTWQADFSAASLGEGGIDALLRSGRIKVRFAVVDVALGVTTCLYDQPYTQSYDLYDPPDRSFLRAYCSDGGEARLQMVSVGGATVPVKADVRLDLVRVRDPNETQPSDVVPADGDRYWRITAARLYIISHCTTFSQEVSILSRLVEQTLSATQPGSF